MVLSTDFAASAADSTADLRARGEVEKKRARANGRDLVGMVRRVFIVVVGVVAGDCFDVVGVILSCVRRFGRTAVAVTVKGAVDGTSYGRSLEKGWMEWPDQGRRTVREKAQLNHLFSRLY